jgi:uncharacterized protein YjbJ (UPF0337 family)
MKLPWILAGIGIGFAAYVLLNARGPEYATGSDTLEDAARGTSKWGSKKRISGGGESLIGKAKEGIGNLVGSDDLANEGIIDQAAGAVKDTAGQVAQAAGQTLHDLNR